jgi:hypothetical protein
MYKVINPFFGMHGVGGPSSGCGCSGLGAVGANNTYVVEKDDYGSKIATKLGCASVQQIIAANPGKNLSKIYAGNVLNIPSACSSYQAPQPAQPVVVGPAELPQPTQPAQPKPRPQPYIGKPATAAKASFFGDMSREQQLMLAIGGTIVVLGIGAAIIFKDKQPVNGMR